MIRYDANMPPERYRGERVGLVQRVPTYVRRILVSKAGSAELGYLLKKREGVEVHGLMDDPASAEVAAIVLDKVVVGSPNTLSEAAWPPGYFDAVIWTDPLDSSGALETGLRTFQRLLAPDGYVFVLTPNAEYWRHATASDVSGLPDVNQVVNRAAEAGLLLYQQWTDDDEAFLRCLPDAQGEIIVEGRSVHIENEGSRRRKAVVEFLLMFVGATYDPIRHADRFFEANRPDWSYEVLAAIPDLYLERPETHAVIATEMLLSLLHWARRAEVHDPLWFFLRALQLFYRAVARVPGTHAAYRAMAEMWRWIGDEDMAARLLRSIQHLAPDEGVSKQILALAARPSPPREEIAVPEWIPTERSPRILYVLHPRVHFGLDVLYDGLCSVAGEGNVIDFPYKPFLHGALPDTLRNYPCTFDRPGFHMSFEQVVDELNGGCFDFVLYGDCEMSLPRETAQALVQAARQVPIFLIDALDECIDVRGLVAEYIGLDLFAGYFKREMIAAFDYGPHVFPMPFAYPDDRVAGDISGQRTRTVFWAGHRMSSLRRVYLERMEAMLGTRFDEKLSQEAYLQALRETQIGINCFGYGFDTVRYWELPAQGCLLLSERLPIHIPHNFRDKESAVFFDDLPDLEKKLTYYLAHPEETAVIAAAGHAHLRRYHTGSARARQLLAWIQQTIG